MCVDNGWEKNKMLKLVLKFSIDYKVPFEMIQNFRENLIDFQIKKHCALFFSLREKLSQDMQIPRDFSLFYFPSNEK